MAILHILAFALYSHAYIIEGYLGKDCRGEELYRYSFKAMDTGCTDVSHIEESRSIVVSQNHKNDKNYQVAFYDGSACSANGNYVGGASSTECYLQDGQIIKSFTINPLSVNKERDLDNITGTTYSYDGTKDLVLINKTTDTDLSPDLRYSHWYGRITGYVIGGGATLYGLAQTCKSAASGDPASVAGCTLSLLAAVWGIAGHAEHAILTFTEGTEFGNTFRKYTGHGTRDDLASIAHEYLETLGNSMGVNYSHIGWTEHHSIPGMMLPLYEIQLAEEEKFHLTVTDVHDGGFVHRMSHASGSVLTKRDDYQAYTISGGLDFTFCYRKNGADRNDWKSSADGNYGIAKEDLSCYISDGLNTKSNLFGSDILDGGGVYAITVNMAPYKTNKHSSINSHSRCDNTKFNLNGDCIN